MSNLHLDVAWRPERVIEVSGVNGRPDLRNTILQLLNCLPQIRFALYR
jgi:hypothetical protein